MPYGTQPFTDGYGDYKQPTIIDYDRKTSINKSPDLTQEEKEQVLNQYKQDQKEALDNILSTNPMYGGEIYQHLTLAKEGKLIWDVKKIDSLKSDVDWLYRLDRYLSKRKEIMFK